MSRKGLFGLIAAIIVIAAAAIVLMLPSPESKDASTQDGAKSSVSKRVACVTADGPAITLNPTDRSGLELAVMGERPTVRAGTNADIFVDKYENKKATGSILYEGGYGSYAFTAAKSSGSDWKVTDFDECTS